MFPATVEIQIFGRAIKSDEKYTLWYLVIEK